MPGETIGEVSIKVRPDTTKFSQELRAQLQKVNDDFDIDVGLDTAGALAEFKALKRRIESDDIKANLKVDTRGLGRAADYRTPLAGIGTAFARVQKALESASRSSLRLANNIIAARKASAAAIAQTVTWAAQMARLVLSVETARKAWVGLSKAISMVGVGIRKIPQLAGLARQLAEIAASGIYIGKMKVANFARAMFSVQTYTNAAYNAMNRLAQNLSRTAQAFKRLRNIRLSDVVNGVRRLGSSVVRIGKNAASGIGRLMDSGISGIGKMFSSAFSGMASMAGKVGESLAGLSRNMILVAAIAAIIAPLIGLISGLLAGLPSLLAAAGAGFAAIYLGMDGIKEAAQVFTPAIDKIKASLSKTFQDGLTPVFKQLNTVMPVLESGLNKVAQGLIPLAQEFTNVVTSAQGMRQIETILANVGKFFQSISPMVGSLTSAFLTLSAAGSESFGFLATVLNDFGTSFNEMVNRITASGAFTSAMQGMAQVLDSILQGFNRVMEAGVIAMGQLGGPMATLVNGLVDAFVALMPILTAVSGLLFDVLGTALSALAPVLTALAPPIQQLANMLGPILTAALQALIPILTPLAQFFGTVLTAALNALMPLVQPIVDLFNQLGATLGGVLTQAATALTPLITILADALGQIVVALTPLIPAFGQLAMAILPPLVDVILQLVPVITQLAQAVLPILVAAIQAAVPVVTMIAQAFAQILPPIISFVGQILGAVIPVITALLGVIQSVFPSIQGIITGVMNVIKGIINATLGIITGDWSRAWNGLKQIIQGAWQAISGAVTGGINLVIGIIRTLPGRILGALGNLGGLLVAAGRSLIMGLVRGIQSAIGSAVSAVQGAVSRIRGFFPFSPAKEGPFSGKGYTTYSGRALVKDWAKGIEDETPKAVSAVENMMNSSNKAANAQWRGEIESEGFGITGSVFDGVMAAFNGSRLQVDGNGMAQLVNKTNNRNARR